MGNRLCDEDCNNCAAIQNQQVALLLNILALRFGEGVWHIANQICPNLTVCPICRIDDKRNCERKPTSFRGGIASAILT